MDDNSLFGGAPDPPAPPQPTAEIPDLDPEEVARRRTARAKGIGREQLIIDQGVTGKGNQGTGLRIGG